LSAVGLALASALLFGGMSVSLRLALDRERDVRIGTFATVGTALLVALAWAAAEAPARGVHAAAAWPFLLAGLLQPGIGQIFATLGIREAGSSRASMVFGVAPLVAVGIAFVFLGEPVTAPVVVGVLLIVGGSIELARERDRPAHVRRIGLLYAFVTVVLFASRDNLVRHLSVGTSAPPAVTATAALLGGLLLLAVAVRPRISRRALPFVPAGICFGLSYVALFEAFYRGRVSVVSPLVATESLVGVALSALILGRRELVGRRLVAGACLIVAGGVLIGATG
jgi:drug/metabolite transporter (DMT)-like permease